MDTKTHIMALSVYYTPKALNPKPFSLLISQNIMKVTQCIPIHPSLLNDTKSFEQ
jgi:hypothetical protein